MKASKGNLQWVLLFIILSINLTESRYVKNGEMKNQLSKQKPHNRYDDVEDIDLEDVLEDYYDDLLKYLEKVGREIRAKKLEKAGKTTTSPKPDLEDFDYMSDMAAVEPEKNTNKESENAPSPNGNMTFFSSSLNIPDSLRAVRERNKEMRLKAIVSQVLSFRGGNATKGPSVPDSDQHDALRQIYEKNRDEINQRTSFLTEKVQSFYPSCKVPKNTDEDAWRNSNSMNLLFDVDFPTPQEDSAIMIISAKLRLYKLSNENYTTETNAEERGESSQNNLGTLPVDEEKQVRISVYWYTKSLKRLRVKKKLLDTAMIPLQAQKWMEFNVKTAVRTWKESRRNFGLVVTIEDEDGAELSAVQYIQPMNCSKAFASVRPVPSIIMDKTSQYYLGAAEGKNGSNSTERIFSFQPFFYPILDLSTREVLKSEVENLALFNTAKMEIENKFGSRNRLAGNDFTFLVNDSSKSTPEKSDTKPGESRVSYFQNVPVGTPTTNHSQNDLIPITKKDEAQTRGRTDSSKVHTDGENVEEKETPRIRHGRRHREMHHKPVNSDSQLKTDFNSTHHH